MASDTTGRKKKRTKAAKKRTKPAPKGTAKLVQVRVMYDEFEERCMSIAHERAADVAIAAYNAFLDVLRNNHCDSWCPELMSRMAGLDKIPPAALQRGDPKAVDAVGAILPPAYRERFERDTRQVMEREMLDDMVGKVVAGLKKVDERRAGAAQVTMRQCRGRGT